MWYVTYTAYQQRPHHSHTFLCWQGKPMVNLLWVSSWLPTRGYKVLQKSADCAELCNDYLVGLPSVRAACWPVPLEELWLGFGCVQKLPRGPTNCSAVTLVSWHIHKAANLSIRAHFQFHSVQQLFLLVFSHAFVYSRQFAHNVGKSTISIF